MPSCCVTASAVANVAVTIRRLLKLALLLLLLLSCLFDSCNRSASGRRAAHGSRVCRKKRYARPWATQCFRDAVAALAPSP